VGEPAAEAAGVLARVEPLHPLRRGEPGGGDRSGHDREPGERDAGRRRAADVKEEEQGADGHGGSEHRILQRAQPEHSPEGTTRPHARLAEGHVVHREPARGVCREERAEADADDGERSREGELDATVDLGGGAEADRIADVGDQLAAGAQRKPGEVVNRDRMHDVVPTRLPDQRCERQRLEGQDDRQGDDRVRTPVEPAADE